MDRARDRVSATYASRWLVDYYFDHGQEAKALEIAREAAEVYSWRGLFTMAHLMERMGQLDEAELYYGRLLQRYEDKRELLGFFYRQARVAKNPAYERRLQRMMPGVFPKGLEELDRAGLPSTPPDGVVVRGENDKTLPHGIYRGHVIVGLDGFRVHTFEEYKAVRSLSQSAEMDLLVWRGRSYDDVRLTLWNRELDVKMEDFKPGAK
jgi:tetratricopeptide (TPR) repeat protein